MQKVFNDEEKGTFILSKCAELLDRLPINIGDR